jgi:hypothetical protein
MASAIALSGLSATALYAAQPTDSVTSDAYLNTAMGGSALQNLAAPPAACTLYALGTATNYSAFGCFNTAAGAFALQDSTSGGANTAIGSDAMTLTTSGSYNVAVGAIALYSNTTGDSNTALGMGALMRNSTGSHNSATGLYSLYGNKAGSWNTATGQGSMVGNNSGNYNTAMGARALHGNQAGSLNASLGYESLYENRNGSQNVAVGAYALKNGLIGSPSTGTSSSYNVAVGAFALYNNTTAAVAGDNTAVGFKVLYSNAGINNTAQGYEALTANTTGTYGTAVGYQALINSQSGLANIGIGPLAGQNIVHGELNIDIGSWGAADESNTVRIGIPGYHRNVYIAGIATSQVTGAQVVVTPSGQLGVLASSERYKTDVRPLDSDADRLSQLRPVSFHLKSEPGGAVQYGLIAEEVDKVYPELVIRDLEGRVQGVRYDELAPMLLHEVQRQQQVNAAQAAMIEALQQQIAAIQATLGKLPVRP